MRRAATAVISTLLFALPLASAVADNIYNNLDLTIDTTAEVINLSAGGATGTVQYRVEITDGDGKNGCNFQGSESITVSVNTSNASVATVSPTSLTFNSCNDVKTITVTPLAVGTSSITLTQTANTTGDSFSYTQATFTVNVSAAAPSDTTPPVISYTLSAPSNANSWHNANVFVDWTVTDGQSAITSMTGCVDTTVSTEGTTTLNCSATSTGGTSSDSVTINLDKTKPVISGTPSGTLGLNGWYKSSVLVDFSCTDSLSGLVGGTNTVGDVTLSSDGADQSATNTGVCTDAAGNTADSATVNNIDIDTTAPTAVLAVTAGTAGTNGWYISDVTVSTTGVDAVSGVTCSADQFQTSETAGTIFNGSCTNGAGVTTNATPLTVKLDKTGPTAGLSATGTLGDNGWYTSNVTISTNGSDSISNPTTCTADQSQTTDTTGETFNGSCTNEAGLSTNAAPLTVKRDATAPSITPNMPTPTGDNGWYNAAFTAEFDCADAMSDIAECEADHLFGEGANQSFTAEVKDNAGNTNSVTISDIDVDATAPTISGAATTAPNANNWYKTDVTVDFTCNDPVSGVATDTIPNEVLSAEGANQTATSGLVACTDVAGNDATVPGSVNGINIDKTSPVVTITTPANGASYLQGSTVNADWEVSDTLSLIDNSLTTATTPDGSAIDTATTGSKSFTVSATDMAGNTTSVTNNYTVFTYEFCGWQTPVTLSAKDFKKTSTIPVKMKVCNSETDQPVQVSGATASLFINGVAAQPSGSSNTLNQFRYDAAAGQYIYNLATKSLTVGAKTLSATFSGGVPTVPSVTITIKP